MLTDLSFLNVGEVFPPKSEKDRLDMYNKNRALFENEHADVYREAFKRIERVVSNFQEVVSYPIIVNYQKLMSLKIADLLLGEVPKIVAGEADSTEQTSVEAIMENTDLVNTAYQAAIDLSRYGDGLLYVSKDGNKGMIEVSQPPIWFPIVDPENIKRMKLHVLAWVVEQGDICTLYVEIHDKGFKEKRQYSMIKAIGGKLTINGLTSATRENTALDDFAVIPVSNVLTSDRIHGMDDYADIDSIISELLVRIAQVARILDKHASPSVTGPMTALERDPITEEWTLKMGNYFPRDGKEDAEVKYITWDGQLDANFKMIGQLVTFLHAISEMGNNLLGDEGENSNSGALSGTALRFKMVSPLAKVKRISMRFAPALKKAIKLCSQLGGEGIVDLSKTPISITFQDGLPNDPMEEAQIMDLRSGHKQTKSVLSLLQQFDGLSPDDAETELQQIQDEEAIANPIMGAGTPFDNTKPTDPNKGGAGK